MGPPARLGLLLAIATGASLPAAGLGADLLRPRDIDALPSREADHRVRYGPEPLQFADLRLPAPRSGQELLPVAIVIHGGCWRSMFATLQNTAALSDALRQAGVATWNVEYRRLDDPGGGWPGTFADVARAADHLRDLATRHRLDLRRVVAVGHSAGGHLALWLAARHRLPPSSPLYGAAPLPLRGVLDLGGPGDLREFTARARDICRSPVIEELLGGSPAAVPERYAAASPLELLPLGVRQLLLAGSEDRVVPASVREAYVRAARERGDEAESVTVSGGHFEVLAPGSPAFAEVRRWVLELLDARPGGTRPAPEPTRPAPDRHEGVRPGPPGPG